MPIYMHFCLSIYIVYLFICRFIRQTSFTFFIDLCIIFVDKLANEGAHLDDLPVEERSLITSEIYRLNLRRRTGLIEDIRMSYLRDVILLKHIVEDHFDKTGRGAIMDQWRKCLPSLDMRQHLVSLKLTTHACALCQGVVSNSFLLSRSLYLSLIR